MAIPQIIFGSYHICFTANFEWHSLPSMGMVNTYMIVHYAWSLHILLAISASPNLGHLVTHMTYSPTYIISSKEFTLQILNLTYFNTSIGWLVYNNAYDYWLELFNWRYLPPATLWFSKELLWSLFLLASGEIPLYIFFSFLTSLIIPNKVPLSILSILSILSFFCFLASLLLH